MSQVDVAYAQSLLAQLEKAEGELRALREMAERVASAQQDEIRICLADRNAACAGMARANGLLAQSQDLRFMPPTRKMNDAQVQLEHAIERHLRDAGYAWDAINRRWSLAGRGW